MTAFNMNDVFLTIFDGRKVLVFPKITCEGGRARMIGWVHTENTTPHVDRCFYSMQEITNTFIKQELIKAFGISEFRVADQSCFIGD